MAEKLCTLDRICVEMKEKGKNYSDWQKERYPVTASHKESRRFIKENEDGEE